MQLQIQPNCYIGHVQISYFPPILLSKHRAQACRTNIHSDILKQQLWYSAKVMRMNAFQKNGRRLYLGTDWALQWAWQPAPEIKYSVWLTHPETAPNSHAFQLKGQTLWIKHILQLANDSFKVNLLANIIQYWQDGWIDGWKDEWMKWMNGWMDAWENCVTLYNTLHAYKTTSLGFFM